MDGSMERHKMIVLTAMYALEYAILHPDERDAEAERRHQDVCNALVADGLIEIAADGRPQLTEAGRCTARDMVEE
jgi:hypothetical protein